MPNQQQAKPQTQTDPSKKKKSNNYFDRSTHDAILALQVEPDIKKKEKIFVDTIWPSFKKLIENMLHVYKFHSLGNLDILKNDCMSFLFENLYKFDGTKGTKAFSYFNVIAKHWFIQKVKVHKKRARSDIHFDKTLLSKLERNEHEIIVTSYEDQIMAAEFMGLLRDEIKDWRKKFNKEQERKVLEAIILLLDNPDIVPIYNKKAIFLFLREITSLNTKQIVTNLSKMKKKYRFFKKKYDDGEL